MTTQQRPFKLGFLTHGQYAGVSPEEHYDRLLEIIVAAEELGYDGAWLAQHHFARHTGVPSPLVLLAAAATRTRTIELGTAITTVTLENPVRLAEDAAVLDAISHGRLQLGLGSGGANRSIFGAFGIDAEDKDLVTAEHTRRYREVVRGDIVHTIEADPERGIAEPIEATLQPRRPELADRIWRSTSSVERAARIGTDGDGLLLGTANHDPLTTQRPILDSYLQALPAGVQPRVGTVRAFWPATDAETALTQIAPAYEEGRGWGGLGQGRSTREIADSLNVHYGSVDEVIAGIRNDPALLPWSDYVIPVVDHQHTPTDEVIHRLELIATQVAPAFGWRPAQQVATATAVAR